VAADGTPRITWHGKDFAAITEIVRLGDVEIAVQVPDLSDPWLRRFYAALVACERIEGANRIASAHVIELLACRFLQQGGTLESWHRYEAELGVAKSKTRAPRSVIQPVVKWCFGGKPDSDGRLARVSAAFDAWLALGKERPDPTPRDGEPGTSQLAEWLRRTPGGYQAVAKAHNARLEYEAALKRGTVWVTHADGTERIYDTKAAGENQNDGPVYEEPAEWWDLQGCEPTGAGEYRRIDPETDDEDDGDPLPERIEGVARSTTTDLTTNRIIRNQNPKPPAHGGIITQRTTESMRCSFPPRAKNGTPLPNHSKRWAALSILIRQVLAQMSCLGYPPRGILHLLTTV
jgi:hypothetical protein